MHHDWCTEHNASEMEASSLYVTHLSNKVDPIQVDKPREPIDARDRAQEHVVWVEKERTLKTSLAREKERQGQADVNCRRNRHEGSNGSFALTRAAAMGPMRAIIISEEIYVGERKIRGNADANVVLQSLGSHTAP